MKLRLLVTLSALAVLVAATGSTHQASSAGAAAPSAPAGLTGEALAGSVALAWQPVSGASGYNVYRGTSQSSITTQLTPSGGTTTSSFTDTAAANGTTYYYAVRAVSGGIESANSLVVQATPRATTCSTGANPVVVENCHPGNTGWRTTNPGLPSQSGIAGFANAQSINKGQAVDLKVDSAGAAFNVEVYRSGYYAGAGARLFSVIENVPGIAQPACQTDSTTGLYDCSNWSVSLTLTTTSSWPSGIYILHLIRNDNGADGEILLVVRDDARQSDVAYGVPFADYQAYNNYGGKSLYDFNSSGANTVAGTSRAVKVSFDRPFIQPISGSRHDWYDKTDFAQVYWLEEFGYDVTYLSNTDLDTQPGLAQHHHLYLSPMHDEYWSAGMRTALTQARDAGVSLFFSGSNPMFWKIRFEADNAGQAGRTEVCYKTTLSGGPDPSGIQTTLWRDPQGANQPENALVGQGYIGDADLSTFPLVVTAAEGKDRIYRYTGLGDMSPGDSTSLGNYIGWEWDGPLNNGAAPAGLVTLASSPVTGNIFSLPYVTTPGSAVTNMTKYVAPSGALVFSTGTNFWSTGLAANDIGSGGADDVIEQITTNILADMGAHPVTPDPDIVLDNQGPPQVLSADPADGSTLVSRSATVSANFSRAMDPTTLTSSTFTLKTSRGISVPASVTYDATNARATLTPSAPLAFSTGYTARVTTGAKATDGQAVAADVVWSFTTKDPVPPTVTSTIPAAGATGVSPAVQPRATFSLGLDPSTVTSSTFTLRNGSTTVSAAVSYNSATQTATLVPNAQLQNGTTYTASLTTGIQAADGSPLASQVNWSFTTAAAPPPAPTLTSTTPVNNAAGVARNAVVTAVFSRAMDGGSITTSSFTLSGSGTTVPATVSYDSASNTATLSPSSPLAYGTSYTAQLGTGVRALDGTPLASAVSWSFSTVAAPPAPTVISVSPTDGSTGSSRSSTIVATFSRSMDPTTITTSSFTITAGGQSLGASVSYDDGAHAATLQPSQPLPPTASIAVTVAANVASADGIALGAAKTWSFTTEACPCSLFSSASAPSQTNISTKDGRSGTGPWSYELGAKVTVDRVMQVNALSFYKSTGETGTHVGHIWTAAGVEVAQVTFANETASGWQQQALSTPILLSPNTVYIVSVNANAYWVMTPGGLATRIDSGPLHSVADGLNGVYGASAGTFPTQGSTSNNYFVDLQVDNPNLPPPTVTATSPAAGAAGISSYAAVTATFSRSIDPSTVTASTFTLVAADGTSVPTTVSYDDTTKSATLVPGAALATSTTYTAALSQGVQSVDGVALASPVSWSFTTAATLPPAPTVSSTSPASGASTVSRSTSVTATFSRSMSATSITNSSFTLIPNGGQAVAANVSYDDTSLTATLQPLQQLAANTTYTARLGPSVRAANGAPLASAVTWSFTTASCPCSLFYPSSVPAQTNLSTQDGRTSGAPYTYELGVKIYVDKPTNLTAISFYKSSLETGTHVGHVWAADGTQLGSVQFANETASGWQRQALSQPIVLQANTVYTVSVNANNYWAMTSGALNSQGTSGPLHTIGTGPAGVYAAAAGLFPATSSSNNYYVDLEIGPTTTPPSVVSSSPAAGATNADRATTVSATFSAAVDATTVNTSTFSLTGPGGAVPATVTYNSTSHTAVLTPSSLLAYSTLYTATVTTGVRDTEGIALASPVTWTFTTAGGVAPVVTSTLPTSNTNDIGSPARIAATFSKSMTSSSFTSSTFAVTGPGGAVSGTLAYDDSTHTEKLTPSAALAAGTYTATVGGSVTSSDGLSLGTPYAWTFTVVAAPAPFSVSGTAPADASTGAATDAPVTASFARSADPGTLTSTTFTLQTASGTLIPATVSYDPSTKTAILWPTAALAKLTSYTATITVGVLAQDGTPLQAQKTWTFTTEACPCSLFAPTLKPTSTNNPVQDGRTGPGPWSYEMGVKIVVDQAVSVRAIRFYKDPGETGTHTGTVWSSSGKILAQVTFTNETASGWQEQALSQPLALTPGTTYVVSVGLWAKFDLTSHGLSTQIVSGPLRSVADNKNGVFGASAGTFPAQSVSQSNYFVDVVVR